MAKGAPTPASFKPGQSGNPNGRPPKGYSITEMMKEMLNNTPGLKESLGKVIAQKALEGDTTAIKTLWQYMDGMPTQAVNADHTGEIVITIKDSP